MHWIRITCALAATLVASEVFAGKPGGGTPPPPPGTICFIDKATLKAWTMDGNGGSRAELGLTGTSGPPNPVGTYRPSRLLHGGARWFLHLELVPGEVGPGGGERYDLFVVRQDGAARLRLTSDAAIAYTYKCEWGKDEDAAGVTVAVLAARWTGTSSTDSVIPGSCGLYVSRLTFDGSGYPLGLDGEPALETPLPAHGQSGREYPDVLDFFAWSPDRARMAFNRYSDRTSIWVADVATGALTLLGAGESPDWSPDGSKIACSRFVEGKKRTSVIETVKPDGTGRTAIASVVVARTPSTSQQLQRPRWSPDGAHVAYNLTVDGHSLNLADWIYRKHPAIHDWRAAFRLRRSASLERRQPMAGRRRTRREWMSLVVSFRQRCAEVSFRQRCAE